MNPEESGDPSSLPAYRHISSSQWAVVSLVAALSAGAVVYRLLVVHRLEQTASLFIGIPAILAILLALTPKARSATGGILKGITLALLIVAPALGEGWFCILIAAPLFYIVGLVIGMAVDWERKRRGKTLACVALILLPVSLEGILPALTPSRTQRVTVTRTINASPAQVAAALASGPSLAPALPWLLRIGFPRPIAAHGQGLTPGSLRTITFSGVEHAPPGDLVLRVAASNLQSNSGYVRFEALSDGSKLAHWMQWNSSEVSWRQIDPTHTGMSWTIHFERSLDPAWYFVPWERAAVHAAASWLITADVPPARVTP